MYSKILNATIYLAEHNKPFSNDDVTPEKSTSVTI